MTPRPFPVEHRTVTQVAGPLVIAEGAVGVGFDEVVELLGPDGEMRHGRVLEIEGDRMVVQVLEGTRGLPVVDKGALRELMLTVSAVAAAHPDIVEIDLNPVIAHGSGYTIADARMILAGA